ncbi:basic proline-rich protein-like [Neopelma chrysocephalum]|uniref:basic proline-rich protein-like n=1 Tax=Neopelma chrysocephalum TaxID=114329 RepID=UPI000FCCFAE3|nr:basic proline-rich protein-like [Neopelma chrysocephalum]
MRGARRCARRPPPAPPRPAPAPRPHREGLQALWRRLRARSEESSRGRRPPERQERPSGSARARPPGLSRHRGSGAALGGRRARGCAAGPPHAQPPAEGLSGAAAAAPGAPGGHCPGQPPPARPGPPPPRDGRTDAGPAVARASAGERPVSAPRRPAPRTLPTRWFVPGRRRVGSPLRALSSSLSERLPDAVDQFGFIWCRGGKQCISRTPSQIEDHLFCRGLIHEDGEMQIAV